MKPLYNPAEHQETLAERGLFNIHNYLAIIMLSLLVFILNYFIGHGIWNSITWTFALLPSTIEQIQMWKVIVYGVTALFWQLVLWVTMGETSILALPGSIGSFVILVFVIP